MPDSVQCCDHDLYTGNYTLGKLLEYSLIYDYKYNIRINIASFLICRNHIIHCMHTCPRHF